MTNPPTFNRIDACFSRLKADGSKALIPFITAGDPDLATTVDLVLEMEAAGADIIELGIPFSDPMSDGPVIQAASERALASGTTLGRILKTVEKIRKKSEIPLVLMGYANPIYAMGIPTFAAAAAKAGVDGVLTVDLPPEEADEMRAHLRIHNMHPIFLLAPTSPIARIRLIRKYASGYIYYISLTGVTGATLTVTQDLDTRLQELRQELALPICIGFGIRDAKSARKVAQVSDGVIVGSALVKLIAEHKHKAHKLKKAGQWIKTLKSALS